MRGGREKRGENAKAEKHKTTVCTTNLQAMSKLSMARTDEEYLKLLCLYYTSQNLTMFTFDVVAN